MHYKLIVPSLLLMAAVITPSFAVEPRCIDENILRKKYFPQKKKCKPQKTMLGKEVIWVLPEGTENVTFYYKNKNGKINFSRTFSADGGYILEMKVNEDK